MSSVAFNIQHVDTKIFEKAENLKIYLSKKYWGILKEPKNTKICPVVKIVFS